ncbi:Aldehyde Dehydrogenase [Methylobacterium sp. 4-46]|uniref:aldehyde dehydrogenase n=1 Tax=unclassified Methylobacterium TaxID=2615210 RepID=UPI000152D81F|nr:MULTISPECIES: aldehyde dehydrogenase [Methylobacterium]ACA18232.1 Aldehyde Dehydrogenase [Methylobacterium sp. 4-46]WFT77529.1 aldehyde dehydrogenase [Methylobacterium nodulans]
MTDQTLGSWSERARALSIRNDAFVEGRFVPAASGRTFDCVFPGTGRRVSQVAACEADDVDRAVRSARRAFEAGSWSRMAPADRKRVMLRFADLLLANRDELALLETLNVGKPITSALSGDIPSAANCIAFYGEAIDKIYGEVAPAPADFTTLVTREPLGVVAAVVPWNYPLSMTAWKLGPALAAGNSVVVKPAEQSPFTALRIAELAMEAGLPPGVLNVVPGLGETAGRALGLHMDVDCVTFTGSTEVGKLFLQYAGRSNAKRVSLELGGKSPQIVMADCADLDAAAQAVAAGIFTNAGQVCNAGSRLIVQESVREELLEKVVARARALKPGDPLDPETRLGPLVSEPQMERVLGYIRKGQEAGAAVVAGGGRTLLDTGGYFVEPTVFDRVENRMAIAQEEIFGPVLSTISVSGFDEAIAVANDTIYGLAASIWTTDLTKAHRAARAIRSGVVYVNCFDKGSMSVPFGGFKQSGFGRDKSLHAIDKYMDLKAVWFAT